MAAALQIWSPTFCRGFDSLPSQVQQAIQDKVDEMGRRLDSFSHHRLTGRNEFRLRVGDYQLGEQAQETNGHRPPTVRSRAEETQNLAGSLSSNTKASVWLVKTRAIDSGNWREPAYTVILFDRDCVMRL